MKTIGLVGGVASGKSLVAKCFVEMGAGLLDGDRIGHAVLAEDAELHRLLRERWGDDIFKPDGSVDRSAVARRVFGEGPDAKRELRFLENLLHPRIRRRLMRLRDRYLDEGKSAVVLDAPVLLEAGWEPMCDLLVMVDSPRELRLQRAKERGWTEAEFDRREAAQWPVDKKRALADVVIQNDGSPDALRQSVLAFWLNRVAQPT